MRISGGLAALLLLTNLSLAQPVHEMRSVWLTTALGLDWPAGSVGAAAQEASLRAILRDAADRNLNAVYFQVVPRGDAFYHSDRLPWSPILTGAAGVDPGFDPLAVAVEEAHHRGLEVHAWYNVYRIQKMSTVSDGPDHVTEARPEWTELDGEWLNPGYPGVNEWIVDNLLEIVERYDVDGIHFDFARYNRGGYLRDDSLFLANNPGNVSNKNDWRRENVNQLMRMAFPAITALKPWIKVGSTPIGNYDETCFSTPFTGFDGVFQDSRLWLQEGVNDYLAPQLYWADSDAGTPSFTCLVNDWVSEKGTGRHVYAGIGLYVEDVRAEIDSQIDVARSFGADGVVFFREEHTRGEQFAGRFDLPALRPPTALRFEASAPSVPSDLSLFLDPAARVVQLSWSESSSTAADPVGWYLVLRSEDGAPDINDPADHRALVFTDRRSFLDTLSTDDTGPFAYAVAAIGRLGLESAVSETLMTDEIPVSSEHLEIPDFLVGFAYPNPATDRVAVTIPGNDARQLTARVVDQSGRVVFRSSGEQPASTSLVIETDGLAAGVYAIVVEDGEKRSVRRFVLVR